MQIQIYDIISVSAILSYFVPLLIVLIKRLWRDRFFVLFASYWSLGGLINICDLLPGISNETCYAIGVVYNLLDIPLILAILYCSTAVPVTRKIIPFAAVLVICLEVAGIASNGFNFEALKYSLGVGIAVVIFFVITEIIGYMQTLEHTNRQNAKMFIYGAVLFEYATFIVIYVFDYYIESTDQKDSYIIYYISTLGAILIASCGYLLFKKYDMQNSYSME